MLRPINDWTVRESHCGADPWSAADAFVGLCHRCRISQRRRFAGGGVPGYFAPLKSIDPLISYSCEFV